MAGQPGRSRRPAPEVTVVIATKDRAQELCTTLQRLRGLPEGPPVIVVDNGSDDATVATASRFPRTKVVEAGRNLGAAGRNLGVLAASTPFIAFADDDSHFAPGSLGRAVKFMKAHPQTALVAAKILVNGDTVDPTCEAMASSALGEPAWARRSGYTSVRRILGFLACGAVVRRDAFLSVNGFAPWLGIGGEEQLLCIDLAVGGWDMVYFPEVVASHFPSRQRDPDARHALQVRNALWVSWLRRSPWGAAVGSWPWLAEALQNPAARQGIAKAISGLHSVARYRKSVPPAVERALRMLEVAELVER